MPPTSNEHPVACTGFGDCGCDVCCPEPGPSSAAQGRVWRGVPSVHATVYRDDDGNEIIGSRGEWMLLAGESVCGPFRTLTEAKQYVEDNDV